MNFKLTRVYTYSISKLLAILLVCNFAIYYTSIIVITTPIGFHLELHSVFVEKYENVFKLGNFVLFQAILIVYQ